LAIPAHPKIPFPFPSPLFDSVPSQQKKKNKEKCQKKKNKKKCQKKNQEKNKSRKKESRKKIEEKKISPPPQKKRK
jgi:flagellar biosynthesis component FlhA